VTEPNPPTPAPLGRHPRARALALAAIVAALLVGVLVGVALDRGMLRHRWRSHGRFGPPPGGLVMGGPRRMTDRLARELDLTPAQRARVDSIMARRIHDIEQVRQDVRPRVRQIFATTRAELDSVLTPAQRDRMNAMFRRHGGGPGAGDTTR
jgi:Spy/CpxP family protein refolding chaperone